jgi:hypothetical protein
MVQFLPTMRAELLNVNATLCLPLIQAAYVQLLLHESIGNLKGKIYNHMIYNTNINPGRWLDSCEVPLNLLARTE